MSENASRKHAIELAQAKPTAMAVQVDAIPEELVQRRQWVAWRWWRKEDRWIKLPLCPATLKPAKTNDPATWGSLEEALRGHRVRAADGVGFVFAAGDGLIGVDIDDCRHPETGTLKKSVDSFIRQANTYAEISPTRTGVKLFFRGTLPDGFANKRGGVEVYAGRRYFTVTGMKIDGCQRALGAFDAALPAIAALRGESCPPVAPLEPAPVAPLEPAPGRGPQFVLPPQVKRPAPPRLLRLWAGLWDGYPSQSEADLALLGMLAPFCDYNGETLDAWFRMSGLMRAKWLEKHSADGLTYGQLCIRMTLGSAPPPAEIVSLLASDVAAEDVNWLWPGYVAFGALTVFDGDPGLGKSTIAADWAARLTTGRAMPGAERASEPAAVLLASCEDSASHTIVPRLEAAGADRGRVRLLLETRDSTGTVRGLQLPDDLLLIEKQLVADGAKLLVVDPLMAFLGRDRLGRLIDAHRDQSVRMLMSEFKALAERTGAAVVVIRHLNKTAGASAVYRGGGSIGITGAARGVLMVGQHPFDSDHRVLAVVKSNLGPRPASRTYSLTGTGAARIEWGEPCEIWADDLLGAAGSPKASAASATHTVGWRGAAEWLAGELSAGPRLAVEINELAAAHDFTEKMVERARKALGVAAVKTAKGWTLSLGQ